MEQLFKWKHLDWTFEKLTEGEALKVVSIGAEENGLQAWRRLSLRFEPELEARQRCCTYCDARGHSGTAGTERSENDALL